MLTEYSAEEISKLARKYAQQGKWDKDAIEVNLRLIKFDNKCSAAYTRLAKCYELMSNYVGALEMYSKVLEFDPNNRIALNHIDTIRSLAAYQNKNMEEIRLYAESGLAFHLTNFNDFKNIMKYGSLLCRNLAYRNGASFSHNTEISASVLQKTDFSIQNYARLALNSNNHAFNYFHRQNYCSEHPSCEMRFLVNRTIQLPQIRISDKVANRLNYTIDITNYSMGGRIKMLHKYSRYDNAEVLISKEIPITCLAEVVIYCPRRLLHLISGDLNGYISKISILKGFKIKLRAVE